MRKKIKITAEAVKVGLITGAMLILLITAILMMNGLVLKGVFD